MVVKNSKKQDLEKVMDECFKKIIYDHTLSKSEILDNLLKALSLSKKIGKLSDNYTIYLMKWIK